MAVGMQSSQHHDKQQARDSFSSGGSRQQAAGALALWIERQLLRLKRVFTCDPVI